MVEGHMGYTYDAKKATRKKTASAARPTRRGRATCGRPAAPPRGSAEPTIPAPGSPTIGTGNPAPWNSHLRPGDNLFSCSTVAIDVKTGKIAWSYQNTPNDGWDFDGVNEFVTFDMNGQRVGAKADRNGFFYINDAKTGKLLNAFPFVKKSHLGGSKASTSKTGRPKFDAAFRPGDPKKKRRQKGQLRLHRAIVPRRQEPDADGLQPEDRPVLRARQRVGHGDLERAHHL